MTETAPLILLVDDEANNRNVLAAQLKNEGYVLLTAASGEEALEIVDQRLPDLVVLDAMMPGLSGFDVADILKSETRTTNIPIIMLTALGDADSRLTALNNGAEEFLTKPIARAELVARIRNLLRLKKYQDRLASENLQLEDEVVARTDELKSATQRLSDIQNQLLQSEKLAAIGQLAAGVAHEINNPIGFVNSNLGTLKTYVNDLLRMLEAYEELQAGTADAAETAKMLQRLRSEIELEYLREDAPVLIDESLDGLARVCKIIQDLKGFARTDDTQRWEVANLHDCLDSTLTIVNNEIKYRAEVVKAYGDIPMIECIPSQLSQVFLNLLVNAAQAMPGEARGTITLRSGRGNDTVWVEVADTGGGIAPEHLSRIFDPFFTTKPVGKGTGLGLSLSYGIIQRHGGKIDVESALGRGTTFRIVLPLKRPPQAGDAGG